MMSPTFAGPARESPDRIPMAISRGPGFPVALSRFTVLFTIGIGMMTLVLALFATPAGSPGAVLIAGVAAAALCWIIALMVLWFYLVFRGVVELLARLVAAILGRVGTPGKKARGPAVPAGVGDDWLDGPR